MGRYTCRILISFGLIFTAFIATNAPATFAQPALGTFVYHQITNMTEGSGYLGYPVLSADGTSAVFSDAPGTADPATPNRIYTIHSDGSGLAEVDSYVPLCYCSSSVDISNDGSVVISTDSVQLRIADSGGVRGLITLTSNEITSISLSGDGQTVSFLIRRDAAMLDNGELVPRGIWAIDASGQNLRQLVSASDVALAVGVPIEQTGCCFHSDGHPLDVSNDGSRIVFGAFAGTGEHVFTADGGGGGLTIVRQAVSYVTRVTISGDGSTLAYDVIPPETNLNEIGVVGAAGGEATIMPGVPGGGFEERIQLTEDGSLLLVSPNGLLFDTATGDVTTLAVSVPNAGGSHEAVLSDGLARATMDSTGQRFLYAMRTVRCADCVNLQEQLAIMEINPADPGEAPLISDASVDPAAISLSGASSTTASATIASDDEVLGVGFVALLDGLVDLNIGQGNMALLDDGSNGDATAGDGVFAASIGHSMVVARDPETGPRTVRIAAEIESSDGMRHATAVDAGTLTVEA